MFCSILLLFALVSCERIKKIPGFNQEIPFSLYGGYIDVSPTHHYYYMFAESMSNSTTDPVLLWLNGGPGCSSLQGFSLETGPFLVQPDGKTMKLNPFAWNKISNMIFLEAPAGVGFSYVDGDPQIKWNDDLVAEDVYKFLVLFYQKFPEFLKNELYIVGESYGGYYVPVLSAYIKSKNQYNDVKIPLKGFMIGNGLFDDETDYNTVPDYLFQHSIASLDDYMNAYSVCEGDYYSHQSDKKCSDAYNNLFNDLYSSGVNPYFLYDNCLPSHHHMPLLRNKYEQVVKNNLFFSVGEGVVCSDIFTCEDYFNNTYVKQAIYANTSINWSICNMKLGSLYERKYTTMVPFYQSLLSDNNFKVLIYSGDCDSVVNSLGTREGISKLKLEKAGKWKGYTVGKLPGGYIQKFMGNLTFVTVRGAGHMAPIQKPDVMFFVFSSFLNGTCC